MNFQQKEINLIKNNDRSKQNKPYYRFTITKEYNQKIYIN